MKVKKSLGILLFVMVINLPPISWILNVLTTENYTYSNFNGSFKCSENYGKGGSYKNCSLNYNDYLKKNPLEQPKQLYRTFTLKPWRFWDWYKWITNGRQRFFLPYLPERKRK